MTLAIMLYTFGHHDIVFVVIDPMTVPLLLLVVVVLGGGGGGEYCYCDDHDKYCPSLNNINTYQISTWKTK
jgi:hypothetical protein